MDIRETVKDLMYELNMAIDEINTMRDIHNTDTLQPADHWDKETLHDAQIASRDFVEDGSTALTDKIQTHHNGNISAYAKTLGVRYDQVSRWLKRDCMVIDGKVYCAVSKQVKESK